MYDCVEQLTYCSHSSRDALVDQNLVDGGMYWGCRDITRKIYPTKCILDIDNYHSIMPYNNPKWWLYEKTQIFKCT